MAKIQAILRLLGCIFELILIYMVAPHFWRESKAKFFKKDLFFVTTPWWLRKLFPGCIWDVKTKEKVISVSLSWGFSKLFSFLQESKLVASVKITNAVRSRFGFIGIF